MNRAGLLLNCNEGRVPNLIRLLSNSLSSCSQHCTAPEKRERCTPERVFVRDKDEAQRACCIFWVRRCNYASIPLPQPERKNHARHHESKKKIQQSRRHHGSKATVPCARKFQTSDASPCWLL